MGQGTVAETLARIRGKVDLSRVLATVEAWLAEARREVAYEKIEGLRADAIRLTIEKVFKETK